MPLDLGLCLESNTHVESDIGMILFGHKHKLLSLNTMAGWPIAGNVNQHHSPTKLQNSIKRFV